jgi:glycine cleavage system T protein
MGGYEPDPIAWDVKDVPDQWEFQLFDDDYEHFDQHMEQAIARVPALANVGVKKMINGPESFTPDGNFILGRASECANMFVGAGFNAFGIAAGGGAGWVLADWVVRGEAPLDLWAVDIRRFSELHRDREWVKERTLEAYGKHYTVAFPHEEYESGRPRLTSPLYEALKRQHAVFGSKLGWERPNWFAGPGELRRDMYSMGRQNWFSAVGREHAHVRNHAGLFDQSSFSKYRVRGRDCAEALNWLCSNTVARENGRVTYTQMLNSRGGIEADLTVTRLGDHDFYIVTGTGFRTHDLAWMKDNTASTMDVSFDDVTEEMATLSLMGPRARDVLQTATRADVTNETFPFGHMREIEIAGHKVWALRLTYVGELGWELHMPIAAALPVYERLVREGVEESAFPVGYRALESLRLEKGYRAWGSDITPNDTPFEAGLGWAVRMKGPQNFLGRNALVKSQEQSLKKRFMGFTVDDESAVLVGRETILRNGAFAGYLTSGGYGYTIGKPIGYGYVRNETGVTDEFLRTGKYELVIANDAKPATLLWQAPYDPKNLRVKA